MNSKKIAACHYAELGYPVFPCVPGGKAPLTAHGFHDAVTDPEQIERWWSRYPEANIGLATAGLLVVDLDGKDNTWPEDAEHCADLTLAGALALTPRGGRHYLFRRPADKTWRCTESRLAPKVDTRTDGGYIVVAPSCIEGRYYSWVSGMELDVCPAELPEPPPWLIALLDALEEPASSLGVGGESSNIIPEGLRNSTLARLAGSMRRVGMSAAEMAAALQRVNADRCVPSLPTDEVERIADSIARYEPDAVAVALAENHYEQMFARSEPEVNEPVDNPDPGPTPAELLHVPGFIDEVIRYTLATAPYPEPVLAFSGALVLQAFLAGRKVRDTMGNRTNMYVLNLANSGVGKDHARKVNARILVEAGLADGLGTSFASGEGIEDRLFASPATLFQVDEMDGVLLRVSQSRDGRHEQIISMLLQMYSAASSIYVMRAKAGRERAVIDQPCLCLFGTAVPQHFYESLSSRLLSNGFVARLLVLECHRRGTGQEVDELPLPENVLDVARGWADFLPGGNLAHEHPEPLVVPHTDDAQTVFRDLRLRTEAEYDQAEKRNDPAGMAIWARVHEKARRLALLYACSAYRHEPVIDRPAAEWASAFTEHQTRRMLFMASRYASESEFDNRRKRLLEVLAKWREQRGDDWMPFWRINRKLPWSVRDHEEIRETLTHQRLIEVQATTTGIRGRPGIFYRMSAQRAE